MKTHKFNYNWKLADGFPAPGISYHGKKVFSCFACGGGSTMGYKLAGYDVIGCNEIDPKMNECYVANHNPKFNYLEDIRTFKERDDLPEELYNLDILDGSPPCSSFSMAGNREKDWGKEKKFKEGQAEQILDTLFFDFIDLAEKLQPKVVVAENVKGLIQGAAKEYVYKIVEAFNKAGYQVDWKLLDASKMGVPQKRQRVFFIALRNDLCDKIDLPKVDMFNNRPILDLEFDEEGILFKEICEKASNGVFGLGAKASELYNKTKPGNSFSTATESGSHFGWKRLNMNDIPSTLLCQDKNRAGDFHPTTERSLTFNEIAYISSFPIDYKVEKPIHIYRYVGMSVPPVMVAQIAHIIKEQWFDKLGD